MNNMSKYSRHDRRSFIGTSVAAGAGVLLASGQSFAGGISQQQEENQFDLIVVGSGAGGMTAALRAAKGGLKVLLLEAEANFGGSTARSGGSIWIRNNIVNQQAGVEDSFEEAQTYLKGVVGDRVPQAKQDAFLEQGPAMIDFIQEVTPLRFRWMEGYSDYYPNLPGAKVQGASIEPEMLDGRLLGEDIKHLSPPYLATPAGIVPFGGDYKWLTLVGVSGKGRATASRCILRYGEALLKGIRPLTMGQALAAGLMVGLKEAGVTIWLNTPMLDLSLDEDSVVNGVVANCGGKSKVLYARYGVVLASGGFEQNQGMRDQYHPAPSKRQWTLGAPGNYGDGIRVGLGLGAGLDLMDDAWWGPTIPLEPGKPYFCLSERSLPGSLMVDGRGRRFVNEASPYHEVVNAMYRTTAGGEDLNTWLIVDQRYRNRYLFKDLLPGLPFPRSWYKHGALVKACSLEQLARQMGIPPESLIETVASFNGFAQQGQDPDFGRGNNSYDCYYGDPNYPNPSLGELNQAPFYGFKIVPGELGTKGGLVTDGSSRVLGADGSIIPKLYASGNVSNGVMGRSYAGAGSTLGPAMTFGYIAATTVLSTVTS